MLHMGTIELETDRLILRKFVEEDTTAMFCNWGNDPRVTKYLCWKPFITPESASRVLQGWIRNYQRSDFYQWAIVLKDLGEPIGYIGVLEINEQLDIVHIGYCIGYNWWNQGITTEAFRAIIPFFFEKAGANRIECQHDPNNPSSGRVMEKCGLKYEGTMRDADWNNTGIVDASIYGLLRSDWEASSVKKQ